MKALSIAIVCCAICILSCPGAVDLTITTPPPPSLALGQDVYVVNEGENTIISTTTGNDREGEWTWFLDGKEQPQKTGYFRTGADLPPGEYSVTALRKTGTGLCSAGCTLLVLAEKIESAYSVEAQYEDVWYLTPYTFDSVILDGKGITEPVNKIIISFLNVPVFEIFGSGSLRPTVRGCHFGAHALTWPSFWEKKENGESIHRFNPHLQSIVLSADRQGVSIITQGVFTDTAMHVQGDFRLSAAGDRTILEGTVSYYTSEPIYLDTLRKGIEAFKLAELKTFYLRSDPVRIYDSSRIEAGHEREILYNTLLDNTTGFLFPVSCPLGSGTVFISARNDPPSNWWYALWGLEGDPMPHLRIQVENSSFDSLLAQGWVEKTTVTDRDNVAFWLTAGDTEIIDTRGDSYNILVTAAKPVQEVVF